MSNLIMNYENILGMHIILAYNRVYSVHIANVWVHICVGIYNMLMRGLKRLYIVITYYDKSTMKTTCCAWGGQ